MTVLTDLTATEIAEKTTARVTCNLNDESGADVGSGALTTLTMTLFDARTKAIINSRNQTNILNLGPGTVDSNGNVVITLTPDDNAIQATDGRAIEEHRLLLEWSWSGGTKKGKAELRLKIVNLAKVT